MHTESAHTDSHATQRKHPKTDLTELTLPSNIKISFPDGKDKPTHFEVAIRADEGMYRGGRFVFDFNILPGYPYDAPKVKCKTKVGQAGGAQGAASGSASCCGALMKRPACSAPHAAQPTSKRPSQHPTTTTNPTTITPNNTTPPPSNRPPA